MSEISRLEAELSRQRAINSRLRSELSTIEYGVSRAHNRIESFNEKIRNTLDNSQRKLEDSDSLMVKAVQTQAEIQHLYTRFKAMEMANKRIRDCNNKKYYDFANYRKVRKLVQGIMDNLDLNMVSDRVIYKTIEKTHLQTPDYWLTCVLLSIMAWRNDDKPLADRAMALALDLDKKSSSIFYMLFNLRMKREDAALKWFNQYQQCELKGSDQRTFLLLFALISRYVNTSEEVSDNVRDEIAGFIRRVVAQSAKTAHYSQEEMVDDILRHQDAFVPDEQIQYPLLRKYSREFGKYNWVMMQAKANISLLEFFREVLHVQADERNQFIKAFIDELIDAANSQEISVYEEIAYNELIIQMEGDVDAAKEIFGKQKIHDQREMNLIYEMIEWVYGSDGEDVNSQSRYNMFVLTKDLQQEAVGQRIAQYRAVDRRHSEVEIEGYKTAMDLADPAGETKKAAAYYAEQRDSALTEVKDWPAYVGFGVGALLAVAAFFTSMGVLFLAALGVGFGVIKLLSNRSARNGIHAQYEENCRLAEHNISALCEEYAAFEQEYAQYDAYTEDLEREFGKI